MPAWLHPLRGWLPTLDRVILAGAGLALCLVAALPIWRIKLEAPQYPHGLYVWINVDGVSGDVAKVDILNHYVGMKPLSGETFPEFAWLWWALLLLGALHVGAATLGRRELLVPVWTGLVAFDLYMLWDFYQWLYVWGHDLDPRAPMRLPPFTPPVLGYKQVANFRVWSLPDIGGWLVILASFATPVIVWRLYGGWQRLWGSGPGNRRSWWPRARASRPSSSRPDQAA